MDTLYTLLMVLSATVSDTSTAVVTISIDGLSLETCETALEYYTTDEYFNGMTVNLATCEVETDGA